MKYLVILLLFVSCGPKVKKSSKDSSRAIIFLPELHFISPQDSIEKDIDSAYKYTLKKDSISYLELKVFYSPQDEDSIRNQYNRLEGKRNWYINKIDSFRKSLRYWDQIMDRIWPREDSSVVVDSI